MKKYFLLLALMSTGLIVLAQSKIDRPKVVVGIVVDQMRAEYLYRFYDHFGEGGFKRLMNDGFELKNGHFNYVPTMTGPGHASVYTGTTPRVHGVIANDWYQRSGKNMYCVEDNTVKGVGGKGKLGQRSPNNLLSTTVTDELGMFFQYQSKIVGISMKDRGAILPAGHAPSGAYWYDAATANFMTSTFYYDELPKWVDKFNKKSLVKQYKEENWNTKYPIDSYTQSANDNRPYEKDMFGKGEPTFPYDFSEIPYKDYKELIKSTPYANRLLTEMAKATIAGEKMGADDITDFLAVSYSATDYVGHSFGPNSKEVQDTYVRLDSDLESFFNYLDEQVGEGEWLVFLTADHAVADVPKAMRERKYTVSYFDHSSVFSQANELLASKYDVKSLLQKDSNSQLFLDMKLIEENGLDFNEIKQTVISFYQTQNGLKAIYDSKMISDYSGWNNDVMMLSAGYNQKRSGDLMYVLEPGWLGMHYEKSGTGHSTHYKYDTHVPMLFYGWGIKQGDSHKYHPITDIAPTISMLLNIKLPNGATGQPIVEILD
ncbi:MAG: alkaline phosphatase family protein [Reichenbachiella sp.]